MAIRILLADDHTLMRQGLRHILEGHADFDIGTAIGPLLAHWLARQRPRNINQESAPMARATAG